MTGNDRPRVVVMDGIAKDQDFLSLTRALLDERGVELLIATSPSERAALLPRADVLVVLGRDRLQVEELTHLDRAVGILCYSIGLDKVPPEAAARGFPVRNVPDYCTDEVSDHALALVLAGQRRLHQLLPAAAKGGWSAAQQATDMRTARRLRGQVMAVVGAGRVGRSVAAKARAFGFRTLAVDPYFDADPEPGFEHRTLDDALPIADVVVLCTALTAETRGLIGTSTLGRMKAGAMLVNVARGGLIDESALADALNRGHISVAALDVRDPEPPTADDPLSHLPNVLATPHAAASSAEAIEDLHRKAADTIVSLLTDAGRLATTDD